MSPHRIVLMSSIRCRMSLGEDAATTIKRGALERVRPVLMTALAASLGFVPMAIATGTGAEIQRPLATVAISGLITSTALTLFVLPAISVLILRSRKMFPGLMKTARHRSGLAMAMLWEGGMISVNSGIAIWRKAPSLPVERSVNRPKRSFEMGLGIRKECIERHLPYRGKKEAGGLGLMP